MFNENPNSYWYNCFLQYFASYIFIISYISVLLIYYSPFQPCPVDMRSLQHWHHIIALDWYPDGKICLWKMFLHRCSYSIPGRMWKGDNAGHKWKMLSPHKRKCLHGRITGINFLDATDLKSFQTNLTQC